MTVSDVTSQLLNFLSQNLSILLIDFFLVLGESKGEATFEAALLPSVRERRLFFLAAAFIIPKSGKQSKFSLYSLFSKQSP